MIEKASVRLGAPANRARDALDVALVIPLQGPAGIFGPSCECCAQLAAEEVNAESGVLGREVRLVLVDGGAPPEQVATEVDALISGGVVDAVAGWHISAVREVVAPRIDGRVPYVYTALYEGGERSPGVFLTGETPNRQLRPALRWFASELDIRRWTIVESCYEGVRMLTELLRRAGDTNVRRIQATAEGLEYESPRGTVQVRDRHLEQRVFLAAADGLHWDVLQQLP